MPKVRTAAAIAALTAAALAAGLLLAGPGQSAPAAPSALPLPSLSLIHI